MSALKVGIYLIKMSAKLIDHIAQASFKSLLTFRCSVYVETGIKTSGCPDW